MWIISKPIERNNEMSEIIYIYGEERWFDGFLIGSISAGCVALAIILLK